MSAAFAALPHPRRLEAFRLRVRAGGDRLAAGDVTPHPGVRQNSMSANLSILSPAGFIRGVPEGRSVRYFADITGIRGLPTYLMEDCGGGNPARCHLPIGTPARPCPPETT